MTEGIRWVKDAEGITRAVPESAEEERGMYQPIPVEWDGEKLNMLSAPARVLTSEDPNYGWGQDDGPSDKSIPELATDALTDMGSRTRAMSESGFKLFVSAIEALRAGDYDKALDVLAELKESDVDPALSALTAIMQIVMAVGTSFQLAALEERAQQRKTAS